MEFFRVFFKCVILFFLFVIPHAIYGVGAYPYPQDMEQPDGTVLTIRLHGDEWFNWVSTIDGYRILKNNKGVFEYTSVLKSGEITTSGIKASNPEYRDHIENEFLESVQPGSGVGSAEIMNIRQSYLSPFLKSTATSTYFAPSGQQRLLVILATFADKEPTYTPTDFTRYMNEENYNGSGSFRDYYLENSNGMLDLESTVTVWVTVPNNKDYYGPRERWGQFAYHAIQAAAAQGVDFSLFDNNGNGIVEGVAIIHQGPGQEVTGDETDIWSHAWSLSSAGYSKSARTFSGVEVNRYTMQPETRNSAGQKNTIGVICHEFGHNLGIPDYYDTSENDVRNTGTGRWDLMASGTYNGSPSGSSPSHHNPFSKVELGWISEITINSANRYDLHPVISSGEVFRVNSPVENEYLLLENRRRQYFDSYLPGEGMIVYHVDENIINEKRNNNDVNAGDQQGLYVLAAGGSVNAASAPFPGSLNVTQLTDETTPATITWSGEPFNRSITGIHDNEEVVVFDFMAVQDGSPLTISATVISHNEIEISWIPSGEGHPVLLAFNTEPMFGEPQDDNVYAEGDQLSGGGEVLYFGSSETELIHAELQPSTKVYYKIWSYLGGEWSGALTASVLTNAAPVSEFPWVDNFDEGLTNWRQSYVTGTYSWEYVSSGLNGQRPDGAYSGEQFAWFYVNTQTLNVSRLVSPLLHLEESESYVLEFRHFQQPWDNDQDELKVLARNVGTETWTELAHYKDAVKSWTKRKLAIPYSGLVEIAFEGRGKYGYGVGVDHVEVAIGSHCGAMIPSVSDVSVTDVTETSMQLSWSKPDAESSVLILAKRGGNVTELPTTGATYTGDSSFGLGQELDNDVFVIYAGNENEVTITDMHHSSDYYFAFFVFDDDFCYEFYSSDYLFSTVQRFFTITFNVSDDTGPVAGAVISIGEENVISNQEGLAFWTEGYSEEFISVSATKTGFRDRWIRFMPDEAKTVNLNMTPYLIHRITGLSHTADYKSVELSWNPIIDEDFDGYEAFSLSLPGWTLIDGDHSPTWSITGINFPKQGYTGSFLVFDPHYEDLLQAQFEIMAPSGRHVLAAFNAIDASNDDWLISPSVIIEQGHVFSFKAKTMSPLYQKERIRVLVEVDGVYELISEGDYLEVPVDWSEFRFSLNDFVGKKVRLAINYVSDDALALLIDKVQLETSEMPTETGSFLKSTKTNSHADIQRVIKDYRAKEKSIKQVYGQIDEVDQQLIKYYVFYNGDEVATVFGAYNSQTRLELEQCRDNRFNVMAEYVGKGVTTSLSQHYFADACYKVVFHIKDENNEPVSNIPVVFNNETVDTNDLGEAIFTGLDQILNMTYSIDAFGYLPVSESISINADKNVHVVLTTVSSDSTKFDKSKISIYPVPVLDDLYIDGVAAGSLRVELFDFSGRLIKSFDARGGSSLIINMSSLPSGVYLVRLIRENSVLSYKVIKKSQ